MSGESQSIHYSMFNFATFFFLSVNYRIFQNFQLLAKRNQFNMVRDLNLLRSLKLPSKYEGLSEE